MDYETYDALVLGLCENGYFEKAEEEKKKILPLEKCRKVVMLWE